MMASLSMNERPFESKRSGSDSADSASTASSTSEPSLASTPLSQPSTPAEGIDDVLEPVAIIGYSLNFPGGISSSEKFWELVMNARSTLTDVPSTRWNTDGFWRGNTTKTGVHKVKRGHFVEQDPGLFDAPFFSMTAAEAECMDPQQRWLLESTYHAFENAGLSLDRVSNSRTSVFIGSFLQDYGLLMFRDPQLQAQHQAIGNGRALQANRLSWYFNLKGPSMSLDTACSGSLIALHLACQSIRDGETDMGIIGGCNLHLSPDTTTNLCDSGFLNEEGKSYSFDSRATGYSRGEGAGIVVVKRLSDAIRDGNVIRAVIRSTGSNQDGKTPGITQPDADAQRTLIQDVYRRGGLAMSETRYFEAHGTGTSIGDPIEARAIAEAFKGVASEERPLYVTSVKPNIGHLENVSAVASLVKTIHILENGVIPPCANLEKLNPNIKSEWPLLFPKIPTPWPSPGLRRASVNSFGYGGANAHAVLDDAHNYLLQRGLIAQNKTRTANKPEIGYRKPLMQPHPRLLVLSAADEAGINRVTSQYEAHILNLQPADKNLFLADLAFTLGSRRTRLPWKSSLVVTSGDALFDAGTLATCQKPVRAGRDFKALFVFTGQGAQWPKMGHELLGYEAFRESLEASERDLKCLGCHWSLLKELSEPKKSSKINEPELSQPICTAVQIALVDLLRSWRLTASAVVGHSSGEIAAAYSAGALSRQSALKLAYSRGLVSGIARKLSDTPAGMMAVGLSREAAEELIHRESEPLVNDVHIACINSSNNVTLSGPTNELNILQAHLETQDIFVRHLKTGVPYHSPYMKSVASLYEASIQGLCAGDEEFQDIAVFSSTRERQVGLAEMRSPKFWVDNLVLPVSFHQTLLSILPDLKQSKETGVDGLDISFVLELGPHPALKGSVSDVLRLNHLDRKVAYSPTLVRNKNAIEAILSGAGQLFMNGASFDILAANNLKTSDIRLEALVDLPAYPFNHSKRYWFESRISKEYRFRKNGYNELLGARDWNSSTNNPRWRHYIVLEEQPWVKDHHFFGLDVYPAAGMMVMAIEAAKQVADPELTVSAYCFRHVILGQALIVPSSGGIETELSFKLVDNTNGKFPTWYQFRLCTYSAQGWSECCSGEIGIEYEHPLHETEKESTSQAVLKQSQDDMHRAQKQFHKQMSRDRLYDICEDVEMAYGDSFRALDGIKYSEDGEAIAELDTNKWKVSLDEPDFVPHVIHPCTLDNIFQVSLAAVSHGGEDHDVLSKAMVPTRIPHFRIASKPISDLKNSSVNVFARATNIGFRTSSIDLSAVQLEESSLVADGALEITAVGESVQSTRPTNLCYHLEWKPDFTLMSASQINDYCNDSKAASDKEIYEEYVRQTQQVRLQAFHHAASKYLDEPPKYKEDRAYLKHYLEFMKRKLQDHGTEVEKCANLEEYLANVSSLVYSRPEGEMAVKVARNLDGILSGSIDPLSLLFEDDLMARCYDAGAVEPTLKNPMAKYVDTMAHKNPGLKVLEIGAGTGSATNVALEILGRNGDSHDTGFRFSRYVYTDISMRFFEGARERFAKYVDYMDFKVLDITKDPLLQGFEGEEYDLIIASNVMHATPSLEKTLESTRQLLKPGGKLLLSELTTPDALRSSFVYGLLPGWWLSTEEIRSTGPQLAVDQWRTTLMENGFTDFELSVSNDSTEPYYLGSVMASAKAQEPPALVSDMNFFVVTSRRSPFPTELTDRMKGMASQLGSINYVNVDIDDEYWPEAENYFCLFFADPQGDWLRDLSDKSFKRLQSLLSSTIGVLWVCMNDGTVKDALSGMSTGLSRSFRSENVSYKFVNLTVDSQLGVDSMFNKIVSVLTEIVLHPGSDQEDEYQEIDGLLHIGRMVQSIAMDKQIYSHSFAEPELGPFRNRDTGREIMLSISTPGSLETLVFVDDTDSLKPLADDEIEVEIRATSLNFKDLLAALGQFDLQYLGLECSGVVRRRGPKAGTFEVGDRVVCAARGAFGTMARCPAELAEKIPDNIPFATAAGLPVIACTALLALVDVGRLTPGETVLIHSGAGGFGQMAIQVALMLGAIVYTTVGTTDKADFLHERYGIPRENILSSRTTSFAQTIKRLTNGRGIDICLNSLGGEGLKASWGIMADFGRFIEVGKKEAKSYAQLPMDVFMESVSFSCIDLSQTFLRRPKHANRLLKEALDLIGKGTIAPPSPIHCFPGSKVEDAFRLLQSGKGIGKIVVEFDDKDQVPTLPSQIPSWSFDPNATYLIAGGLGGLGRYISLWMADRGARNLILLSRRRPEQYDEKILSTLGELKDKGVSVATPRCDVTDASSLQAALKACSAMPPLKGCIQASMVLRDEMLLKMSVEGLYDVVRPKVEGSLNLHEQLPKNMDFFILFSSMSGVTGWQGQSNYSVGNVFQDKLARWRVSQGLKTICIDFGVIYDVGYVAENDIRDSMQKLGIPGITAMEVVTSLEHFCDPRLPVQSEDQCQVIIGMENKAECSARGGAEGPWDKRPMFSCTHRIKAAADAAGGAGGASGKGGFDLQAALKAAKTSEEAAEAIATSLTGKMATMLGIDCEEIDRERPLHSFGIDSLVALDVRNWFRKAVGSDVAVFEILSNQSITELCQAAAYKSSLVAASLRQVEAKK